MQRGLVVSARLREVVLRVVAVCEPVVCGRQEDFVVALPGIRCERREPALRLRDLAHVGHELCRPNLRDARVGLVAELSEEVAALLEARDGLEEVVVPYETLPRVEEIPRAQ